ncbi:MAG: 4Fe-4S binding protein [Planctomycetaceae bacterium]|nr:4Fe-4S binding protein [Planctomycetaceae bacterium]
MSQSVEQKTTRRAMLKTCCRYGIAGGLLGSIGFLASKEKIVGDTLVWQIDPLKCIGCGLCAYRCNKMVSAVKCFHTKAMCGYCDLCTGFFNPQPFARNEGAENQLCPTDAFTRRLVEPPYFEYNIDHDLCIGCGKCVDGCFALGNGSLYLQISHKECLRCNQCQIALHCPTKAIGQIPAEQMYLLKEA